jgi:hypothetical protein
VTDSQMAELRIGNVVRSHDGAYVITRSVGGEILATRTLQLSDATKWEVESQNVPTDAQAAADLLTLSRAGVR